METTVQNSNKNAYLESVSWISKARVQGNSLIPTGAIQHHGKEAQPLDSDNPGFQSQFCYLLAKSHKVSISVASMSSTLKTQWIT